MNTKSLLVLVIVFVITIGLRARIARIEQHIGLPAQESQPFSSKQAVMLVVAVLLGVGIGILLLKFLVLDGMPA